MCKCLPSKCDCNPLAEDPDSFCSGDDVCKVGGIISTYLHIYNVHIYISKYLHIYSGLRVPAPLPAGLLM